MKKYIKYIAIICLVIVLIAILIITNKNKKENDYDGKFKIVTSFYPIYVMTSNIVEGANNIELTNMADTNVGCIHNYTLTTLDMKKIENANVFVENGLGLESFTDKIIESNKKLQIINSSKDIENIVQDNDEVNPHIWTSISNYIIQVENIQKALSEKNPENASIYEKNAKEYVQILLDLKEKYNEQLSALKGKSAVSLNESFDYLGKEIGLNLTSIHTSHEESALSAEKLKNIINTMKQNNTNIIIVDIDDDLKNAQTIANETNAQIYMLDSGLKGDLSKEAYINSMNDNLEELKNAK